jgi:hypothetical protein
MVQATQHLVFCISFTVKEVPLNLAPASHEPVLDVAQARIAEETHPAAPRGLTPSIERRADVEKVFVR